MNGIKKINAKVIGKWIKGNLWKRPKLSIDFVDNDMTPKFYDLPVTMAFWNACEKGSKITVTMEYDKTDKLWYPI